MRRRRLVLSAVLLACVSLPLASGCDLLADLADGTLDGPIVEPPPPPPLSGGTLFVTPDQRRAVASDSAHDRVFVIDLESRAIAHEIDLDPGDEPGRTVAGPDGTALVALRRGGAVLSVDIETGESRRRNVCPSPRGVVYDPKADVIHVACSGGELVTLPSSLSGPNVRELRLERDLRDVLVKDGHVVVSRFRSAEVLVLDDAGDVVRRFAPSPYTSPTGRTFEPSVGYRMTTGPTEGSPIVLVHQRSFSGEIPVGPLPQGATYYGGPCDATVVHAAVTSFDVELDASLTLSGKGGIGNIPVPVDVAVSADGRVAVAAAGNGTILITNVSQAASTDEIDRCSGAVPTASAPPAFFLPNPLALRFGLDGGLYIQSEDVLLSIRDANGAPLGTVPYPEAPRHHTGQSLFQQNAGPTSQIACASCHPEGGEDGRVWRFQALGEFRTQSTRGGVLGTMPLHWEGDMPTFGALLNEVMVNRMGGTLPDEHGQQALADWIDSVPDLPRSAPIDASAAERGDVLFHDPAVGCADCHSGPRLTNDATVDVGTGRALQVPSLVGVADRLPIMHNGCGHTLMDRFDPSCGGGDSHGTTSQLSAKERADLVAYLETL